MKRFLNAPFVGWSGIPIDAIEKYVGCSLDVNIVGEGFEGYSLQSAVAFFLNNGDSEWEMNIFDDIIVFGESYGRGRIEIMNDEKLSFWLKIDSKEEVQQKKFIESIKSLCKEDEHFFCVPNINSVEGSQEAYAIYKSYAPQRIEATNSNE